MKRVSPAGIAVTLLLALWLLPLLGLAVTSLRAREHISVSGWWTALRPVEHSVKLRLDGAAQTREGALWVVSGDALAGTGTRGRVLSFGLRARSPDAFAAGHTVALDGGAQLHVAAQGTYRLMSERPIAAQATRLYVTRRDPPRLHFGNYARVLDTAGLGRTLVNTLGVAIPATVLPCLFAALAAYGLAWLRLPGRRGIMLGLAALMVVPLQMALVPALGLHRMLGLGQSLTGGWLAHTGFGLPLAVYVLHNRMAALPRAMILAARLDGASDWRIFRRIVLPLSWPALAGLGAFQFLWVWNDFLVAKVFLPATGAGRVLTVTLADDLMGSHGGDWGLMAAAAMLSMLGPLAVFTWVQRAFLHGLAPDLGATRALSDGRG